MVDTAQEPRLSRLFSNRVIHVIRHLKSFTAWKTRLNRLSLSETRGSGAGREETNPVSAGPVGGGKSSLAERLKSLMQLYRFMY